MPHIDDATINIPLSEAGGAYIPDVDVQFYCHPDGSHVDGIEVRTVDAAGEWRWCYVGPEDWLWEPVLAGVQAYIDANMDDIRERHRRDNDSHEARVDRQIREAAE